VEFSALVSRPERFTAIDAAAAEIDPPRVVTEIQRIELGHEL
jgi:hypothetical protein